MITKWIYDIETYPNVFTFSIIKSNSKFAKTFEISSRKNQIEQLFVCLDYLIKSKDSLVGFNNIGFDYPIVHKIIENRESLIKYKSGTPIASRIYKWAQDQIESMRGEFGNTVRLKDVHIPQIDLFKIHHFDNKAKSTSLKMIEFNMKSHNIEDLPFAVGTKLTDDEIDTLIKYNEHDVKMTLDFYKHTISQIEFREQLTEKYNRDFMNHNDTKIGKDYFIMCLENANVPVYKEEQTPYGTKKVMNQTKRSIIQIKDCLFDYYNFSRPEFIAVLDWLKKQNITETKGVFSDIKEHMLGDVAKYSVLMECRTKFKGKPTQQEIDEFLKEYPLGWVSEEELKATEWLFDEQGNHVLEYPLDDEGNIDILKKPKKVRVNKKSYWKVWRIAETLNVIVDGFRFDFGTGGIHGSIENKIAKSTKKYDIVDADVSSMYPNIAISNSVYPEHLTMKFCEIYKDLYEQRKSCPKGSTENAMLKLALNGVYGDSNNKFSVFYDPKYTMSITINGQLSLCLLAEQLLNIEGLKIIQVNTDGITVALKKDTREQYDKICEDWQKQVKLQLEFAEYSKMIIRDVNNYIAVYTNGEVKRKGAYQYEDLGWHQNQSALVIPMAAEACMLQGVPVNEFIMKHSENQDNKWDFMLRTKVPRSSRLVLVKDEQEIPLQNICRYYPCKDGGKLVKIMPPLEEGGEYRRLGIDTAWTVVPCNNIDDFKSDIDYEYYINESNKLLIGVE